MLEANPDDKFFGVIAGGSADLEKGMLVGTVRRRDVKRMTRRAFRLGLCFERSKLFIAPEVPPDMPVKHARQVLDCYASSLLFVTQECRVLGAASFVDMLDAGESAMRVLAANE